MFIFPASIEVGKMNIARNGDSKNPGNFPFARFVRSAHNVIPAAMKTLHTLWLILAPRGFWPLFLELVATGFIGWFFILLWIAL